MPSDKAMQVAKKLRYYGCDNQYHYIGDAIAAQEISTHTAQAVQEAVAERDAQLAAECAIADYMADAWAGVETESHCSCCKDNSKTSDAVYSRWRKHLATRQPTQDKGAK